MLTLDKIYSARFALNPVLRHTDLIKTSLREDCEVYLKPECLQVTGSFKVRGAYYKISQLSEEEKARGVIACSAGNHAQGVALAAQKNGIRANICIPDGAPISKVEATKSYGAQVTLVKGVYDDAYRKAVELQQESGATFIHPFNDENVIAGQGTIGLEILDELADADVVVVPVGGGGLISGVAFAVKSLNPRCKVYGVQSAGAPRMVKCLQEHKIQKLDSVSTIADGIMVKEPGDLTYDLCSRYVDDVVTVTDDEVSTAILTLIEKQKMIAEGAGAVSLAAVMFDKIDVKGKKVVAVISGGNIDVTILSRVIGRGLLKTGRSAEFTIELPDKPGQLVVVSSIVAGLGANVVAVHHDHAGEDHDITACTLRLCVETRDHEHVQCIRQALEQAGYRLL